MGSIVKSADTLRSGLGEKLQSSLKFGRLAQDVDRVLTATASQRQIFISSPGFTFRTAPWRKKTIARVVVKRDWSAMAEQTEDVEAPTTDMDTHSEQLSSSRDARQREPLEL